MRPSDTATLSCAPSISSRHTRYPSVCDVQGIRLVSARSHPQFIKYRCFVTTSLGLIQTHKRYDLASGTDRQGFNIQQCKAVRVSFRRTFQSEKLKRGLKFGNTPFILETRVCIQESRVINLNQVGFGPKFDQTLL